LVHALPDFEGAYITAQASAIGTPPNGSAWVWCVVLVLLSGNLGWLRGSLGTLFFGVLVENLLREFDQIETRKSAFCAVLDCGCLLDLGSVVIVDPDAKV
jgi:hypothetical protein